MKLIVTMLAGVVLLTGCEKAREAQQAASNMEKLSEAGDKMQSAMKESAGRQAERVRKGDTLALPYKELETYLPASISGYTAAAPEGESMKTSGMSFSTATRKYTQGDNSVEVKLIDYNGAHTLFQGVSAIFGMGMESENDETLTRTSPMKLEGTRAMETLNKKDGDAELSLVAGDRFMMSIKATHQKDFALVESVAQQLDFSKLAKL